MKQAGLLLLSLLALSAYSGIHAESKATSSTAKAEATDVFSGYPTKQVAANTYVIHGPLERPTAANRGFINNPGFVVTGDSVVVVDPGSSMETGKALLKRIAKITDKPVTHVFNTHVHGDHWLGNQAIVQAYPKAQLLAHPEMIKEANAGGAEQWIDLLMQLTEGAIKGTEAVVPAVALEHGQTLSVGGHTFEVVLTEHAHTHTDAMIIAVEEKVLFTGDNLTWKRIPRMDDGSFRGNISILAEARGYPVEVVVPGHGMTGGVDILKPYHDYLDMVYSEAARMMDDGLEAYEMKPEINAKLVDFHDWSGYDDELGKHISLSVLEAEEAAF